MNPTAIVQHLAPFLSLLSALGPESAKKATSQFGVEAWEQAKAAWDKLYPYVEATADAKAAVSELAANPTSPGRKTVLQEELEKLLQNNPSLAAEIAKSLQLKPQAHSDQIHIQQSAAGNGNQIIGHVSGQSQVMRDVHGSVSIDQFTNKSSISAGRGAQVAAHDAQIADRGGQVVGGNATRGDQNFFSRNSILLILLGVLALGAAWALGLRVEPDGISIDTNGNQPAKPTASPSQPVKKP